jgi:hypothetical protein
LSARWCFAAFGKEPPLQKAPLGTGLSLLSYGTPEKCRADLIASFIDQQQKGVRRSEPRYDSALGNEPRGSHMTRKFRAMTLATIISLSLIGMLALISSAFAASPEEWRPSVVLRLIRRLMRTGAKKIKKTGYNFA